MRLLFLVLLAACGHGECPPGEVCVGMFPGDGGSCTQLSNDLADTLLDTGRCTSDQDCMIIGGQFGQPTCDCAAFAGECSGVAIARTAPGLARAQQLIAEMSSCDNDCGHQNVQCVCDCAPADFAFCESNGRCSLSFSTGCNVPPPIVDAGEPLPPDAP